MAHKPNRPATEIGEQVNKWEQEGQVVEGKLIKAEIDVKTSQGVNNVYHLENEDGAIITVFGSSVINRKMGAVALGSWVTITFVGTRPGSKAGRTVKMFKVEQIGPEVGPDDDGGEEE